MADAPRISIAELRGFISDAAELAKGTQLADGGAVVNPARHENRVFGEAKGSGPAPYRVSLTFGDKAGDLKARCSCMAARSRPFCKHSAALLVAWARAPESFVVSEAPPVSDAPARKAKSVKTGKAEGADLMKHGVERVLTLVRELAVAGIAAAGADRVDQVRQLAEGLRENRLRRLSARTLELSAIIGRATTQRGYVDADAYADLLADLLLTGRKLERHLGGEPLDDRYVEELIGKTWRAADRKPIAGLDLVEYAFLTRVTPDNFVIRESRFVDLQSGAHYCEKQILPAALARRTEPKRSYAGRLLRGTDAGVYPGFPPHRLDLGAAPEPVPLDPSHVQRLLERTHAGVASAVTAFQEHRRDVFAPDSYPLSVRAVTIVAADGRLRAADETGEAVYLPSDSRLDEALPRLLRQGRLQAIAGDMVIDGLLATLVPHAFVLETPAGLSLSSLDLPRDEPRGGADGAVMGDNLAHARRAGVSPAAIALAEVRREMADVLVAGLAGLVTRITDPLATRLTDLGLDKPAALLTSLPAMPDAADRLEGFVKVHQVAGIALVRMAGVTTIDAAQLEPVPAAESIAIHRPSRVLSVDELVTARISGGVTRYEAAWHRGRQLESMAVDDLLSEWPSTWSDGEAAPFIARMLASTGDRAVTVAREVLADEAAGRTAKLTAIRVLTVIGREASAAELQKAVSSSIPAVRARALEAAGIETSPWRRWIGTLGKGQTKADILSEAHTNLMSDDRETRTSGLHALELSGAEEAIPLVRQMWRSDPVPELRARAVQVLALLGDTDAVDGLLAALRDRATQPKNAKVATMALAALGDVRGVPEVLQALIENWAGPVPGEALPAFGVCAVDPILALVTSRHDLAQRKSLQGAIAMLSESHQVERLLTRRIDQALASDQPDAAAAILKVASENQALQKLLATRVVERVVAPSTKPAKALLRAAHQILR